MFKLARTAALGAALSLLAWPAQAAVGFDAQASVYVDDADGTGFDVAARLRPVEWLSLSLGGGQSSTSADATDFEGTAVHGGVDLQRGRFGAGLHASQWDDSDQFRSRTLGGELSWTFAESVELAVLLEDRALEIDYATTGPLGRVLQQSQQFDGTGLGARLAWYGEAWSVAAGGKSYDYDDTLERVIAISRSPNTARLPRIASLVNSVMTRTVGAIDYQATLTVDRAFARAGVGADLTVSRDALTRVDSTSYGLHGRYDLTTHWGVDASVGLTDTDGLDSVGFASLGFSFRN